MYGFQPSEDQRTLIEAVHRFAVRELRPHLRAADDAGALPESTTRSGWELGLLPASLPDDYGGFGGPSPATGAPAPGQQGRVRAALDLSLSTAAPHLLPARC